MNISSSPYRSVQRHSLIEPLEQRIAPAALPILNSIAATVGSPIQLHAGDVLSTSQSGGTFLLFVEKGSAVVYTTDLNNNSQVDFNEITGISAGDGLRLISFVDIHGDIVTNLNANGQLTDSDNNASNGLDGRVLLGSKIEKITLRSLTQDDLPVGTNVQDRLALSTYSIFGNIYAGGGFGAEDGGLTIDVAGNELQALKYTGDSGITRFVPGVTPSINSIKVGTAASGGLFSFGTTAQGFGLGFQGEDVQGSLQPFRPASGSNGADIINVHIADRLTPFNLGTLQAGDGGFDGRGGNVTNVEVTGDFAGGYSIIAGNAGVGSIGKVGGSIINFSDRGSITSEVLLQSGNGGRGLLGAGGAGGGIDLVADEPAPPVVDPTAPPVDPVPLTPAEIAGKFPINIAGRLIIRLGDGGDGLTAGGNGASQKEAIITSPEGGIPFGLNTVTSTRHVGDIFNTISDDNTKRHAIRSFDFDLDGFNDIVYTSKDPDQLVVLFGTGAGVDQQGTRAPGAPGTIYLNGPANAEALAVGDLNGDGHPDIVAASQDSSFAGVSVYLSVYVTDPATRVETFIGFRDPIQSTLPHLANYFDTIGDGYYQEAQKITDLVIGDFDGDGVVDLAMSVTGNILGSPGNEQSFVMVMRGDTRLSASNPGMREATGYFFSDFTGAGIPFSDGPYPVGFSGETIMKATALQDGSGQDVFIIGLVDAGEFSKDIYLYDYSSRDASAPAIISLGQVDTNRDPMVMGGAMNLTKEDVTFRDFSIADLDDDGDADLAVLSNLPATYLISLSNNGTGFTIATGDGVDQAGINLDQDSPKGLGLKNGNFVGVLTTAQADGVGNDITIVDYNTLTGHLSGFLEFSFNPTLSNASVTSADGISRTLIGLTEEVLAFDTYRPIEGVLGQVGYAFAHASKGNARFDRIEITAGAAPLPFTPFYSLANNGYFLTAGDGGDSSNGVGGSGGQLGRKLVSDDGVITGTLNITVPANLAFSPIVRLIGGDGGEGYSGGGVGGDVRGVTTKTPTAVTFNVGALVLAGNGGDSVRGKGGDGGNLDALSILGGTVFFAGDGGRGVMGGNGGSVIGNKIADAPDTTTNAQTLNLAVSAGDGGLGLKHGGNGGDVRAFVADFRPVIGGESNALLRFAGGDGGNSLSGAGGNGGSVINSGPTDEENNLVNDIVLIGGRGGDGRRGGNGGDIQNFVNSPGTGSVPLSVSVLAGYGGAGTAGPGGTGGNIRDVNVSARGVGFVFAETPFNPDQLEEFPFLLTTTPVNFGRYIAGQGGDSSGGVGGVGGSLSNVTGISASSSFVVAAGKGGDGLTGGARGGNVTNAVLDAAASGKVLVIAGDGGDVYGSRATLKDPLAVGGSNGFAGNGGNISGISQSGSTFTVFDLIAGNGGSTINFGTSLDSTTRAGRGGSIKHVEIEGNVGVIDFNVAIKSYNNTANGELVSDFVTNVLVNNPAMVINNSVGNVGIVVGATGRVKDNNNDGQLDPASVGRNGSLIDVTASNIMSAVAGSVDRIASIQKLVDVQVTTAGAIFGADKLGPMPDPDPLDSRDYRDEAGNTTTDLILGGSLIDGAIVAKNQRDVKSIRDFIRR